MKKIPILMLTILALACNRNNTDNSDQPSESNSEEKVNENSGKNISPQLERDSADRLGVDTISSPGSSEKQKEEQLNN
jgi:hypothetical protein